MVFSITIFATLVLYLVIGLFDKSVHLPFNSVIMSTFIIVIFIDPVRQLLKRIFTYLFSRYKDIDLLDEEVEKGKSALLEEMATGLAHEIRNPLGSIKGAAQYLKSEADTDRNHRLLNVIIEETDRLDGVMSRFLNYANPYSTNADMQDINRIVEKIIDLLKTTQLPDNTVIEKHLDYNVPPVKVDGEQIMQVLMNLALNGIEAMPAGGTLSFSTSRIMDDGQRSVEINVHDTGCGIKSDDLKNMFKPFFTTKKTGVGLGLSICKRIIGNHGGRITVESEPDQGTTFLIRI
jgi:signal transduction histidine kinase